MWTKNTLFDDKSMRDNREALGYPRAHHEFVQSRRDFLLRCGGGFGALALTSMLAQEGLAKATERIAPRAKRAIFLFMEGGPSHMDTFDPKPLLNELAGQTLPASFGEVITPMGESRSPLLASKRKWAQHGESGIWVSDWLPHTAKIVDDIAVIRSCKTDGINHSSGVCQMNTCSILGGRPSLGSWVSYGLGTENQDLPAFVVMQDNAAAVTNGPRNWGAGFMPATYQGIRFRETGETIPHLQTPKGISQERQIEKLRYLQQLNQSYAERFPQQTELEARIASYELAFRMQAQAPYAVDLGEETEQTERMYGLDQPETAPFGKLCLLARRLSERGVRFVQLYSGSGSKWDAHSGIEANHTRMCKQVDQPVAALVMDLKQRGLLDETLVIWGGEFGRTPMSEKGDGRDHNVGGFTMWMAGGGVQGGQTIGETDELGLRAIRDPMHVTDIHASILHLMGVDPLELTYMYKGRPERPTVNEGTFQRRLVASA